MRGSLRQLGPDRWQLRVYRGRDPETGRKRYLGRVHHGGKRSAQRALNDLVAQVQAGELPEPGSVRGVTVAEHLDRWVAAKRASWSPSQPETARTHIDRWIFPMLGDLEVRELRLRHVDAWVARLSAEGLSPAYVRRIHTTLRAALEQAVRWELADRNAAVGASLPRVEKADKRVPLAEHVRAAIDAAGDDLALATLVRLAAATGARRGQLVGLQWRDIDHDAQVIVFRRSVSKTPGGVVVKDTKTGAVIRVPVGPGTLAQLQRWRVRVLEQAMAVGVALGDEAFVFGQDVACSVPWYPDTASVKWRRLAASVEIDGATPLVGVSLHALRHAQGTGLIAAGVDVRTVASRLGHSSPNVTLAVYAHPVTAAERVAAEISESWLGS